jgi:hypothetical protein
MRVFSSSNGGYSCATSDLGELLNVGIGTGFKKRGKITHLFIQDCQKTKKMFACCARHVEKPSGLLLGLIVMSH